MLEGGIGVYALLLPVLIAGTEPFFRVVYQNIGASFYVSSLLRFVVCGLLLLVQFAVYGLVGAAVYLPLRDRTIRIYSESPEFLKDFNDIIVPSITFVP